MCSSTEDYLFVWEVFCLNSTESRGDRESANTLNDCPRTPFQVSLKSLLIYAVVAALAITTLVKLASVGPMAIALGILWMIITAPFVFFADVVDWLLGVKKRKN